MRVIRPPGRSTLACRQRGSLKFLIVAAAGLAFIEAFAIDGFGTASSSFANLAQLPFDEVKIGAAYVGDMRQASYHAKIVRSLAHLAQDLGFGVTADGVEDAETAAALSALGCARIQGNYVGRPLTAEEVLGCGLGGAGPVRLPLEPGA